METGNTLYLRKLFPAMYLFSSFMFVAFVVTAGYKVNYVMGERARE